MGGALGGAFDRMFVFLVFPVLGLNQGFFVVGVGVVWYGVASVILINARFLLFLFVFIFIVMRLERESNEIELHVAMCNIELYIVYCTLHVHYRMCGLSNCIILIKTDTYQENESINHHSPIHTTCTIIMIVYRYANNYKFSVTCVYKSTPAITTSYC